MGGTKMNYRIKEIIRKDGRSHYHIQRRFLFIWADFNPPLGFYHYSTLSQAQTMLEGLRNSKIVNTKIHY